MADLSPDQAVSLNRVLSAQGVDTSELKASNPWSAEFGKTPRGKQIQMLIEASSPQLAVDLKNAEGLADHQPSLAMAAAIASNVDPATYSPALQAEYQRNNPAAVAEAKKAEETRLMEFMDDYVEKAQRAREGDKRYEARIAEEKAQAETQAQRNAEAAALNQRMAERRQQDLNAARISQGGVIIPN